MKCRAIGFHVGAELGRRCTVSGEFFDAGEMHDSSVFVFQSLSSPPLIADLTERMNLITFAERGACVGRKKWKRPLYDERRTFPLFRVLETFSRSRKTWTAGNSGEFSRGAPRVLFIFAITRASNHYDEFKIKRKGNVPVASSWSWRVRQFYVELFFPLVLGWRLSLFIYQLFVIFLKSYNDHIIDV